MDTNERLSKIAHTSNNRWWLDPFFWKPDNARVIELHKAFLARQVVIQTTNFYGLQIQCAYGTYHPLPGSSSDLLAQALDSLLSTSTSLLDVGTGTGALALFARARGLRARGTDCDSKVVNLARANAAANGMPDVEFSCAHMLDGIPKNESYDLIVFNCPLLMSNEAHTDYDHIACDPDGRLLREFLEKGRRYLSDTGRLVFIISNIGNFEIIERACRTLNTIAVQRALHDAATQEWRFVLTGR